MLIGEVALVHDAGGLLAAGRAGADLHVICVNNGGGGIFDFLPLPGHADAAVYEQHVATPTGVEPAALAALAGMKTGSPRCAPTAPKACACTASCTSGSGSGWQDRGRD